MFLTILKNFLADGWSLFRGYWDVARTKTPRVSILGGKLVPINHHWSRLAYDLGAYYAQKGYTIFTGGGPGIMSRGLEGACERLSDENIKTHTLGITLAHVDDPFEVTHKALIFRARSLWIRKYLLLYFSEIIVVMPGGVGTVDELLDVLNNRKFSNERSRIILVDSAFWNPLLSWLFEVEKQGLIKKGILSDLKVVDTLEELKSL